MNNTKRSSPGEGKLPLKLVAIEIEPRPIFRTRSFRQSWRQKDARSWNCWHFSENIGTLERALRCWDITCLSILSFPLKDFWQTEQNQLMSTPQEQNVDWERGRMLRIYIGFQATKFYCFPTTTTTTTTTFLLFSLHHHHHHHRHHISIVFPPPPPPPPPPPHFYCFPSTRFYKRLPTAILSSFCSNVSCSEQQSWFSSAVSWLPCLSAPVSLKDNFSTTKKRK